MKKENLEQCLKKAYSFESREGWKKQELKCTIIGTIQSENKLIDVYKDEEGNFWYKNRYMTGRGIISEFEMIFGFKEKKIFKKGERLCI